MPATDDLSIGRGDQLLATVAEHWMSARIDAPLAAIERVDGNAKQLIALAGILQGVLTAVVKLAKIDDRILLSFAIFAFCCLFAAIYFAARAIVVQVDYLATSSIVELLKTPRDERLVVALGHQIVRMCRRVDRTLGHKCRLVRYGMHSFTLSMLGSLSCLVYVMVVGLPDKKDAPAGSPPVRTSSSRFHPRAEQRVEVVRPHLAPR